MEFEDFIKLIAETAQCEVRRTGEPDEMEYTLTFDVGEGRKQDLIIYLFEEEGKKMVRLISFVGKKQDFSQNKLVSFLELNMSLRYGAFALYQGQVVLVSTALYSESLQQNELLERMGYLIHMADKFEKTLIGLDRK